MAGGDVVVVTDLAQSVEHGPFKPVVAGSSPAIGILAPVAQWITRPPSKRKTVGSTPTRSLNLITNQFAAV